MKLPELIARVNAELNKHVPATFHWTSLQVNVDSVSRPHRDANNAGDSAIFTCGNFTGGEFVSETHGTLLGPDQNCSIFLSGEGVTLLDKSDCNKLETSFIFTCSVVLGQRIASRNTAHTGGLRYDDICKKYIKSELS